MQARTSVLVSHSEIRKEAETNLTLFSTSSSEPHAIQMFVGEVSRRRIQGYMYTIYLRHRAFFYHPCLCSRGRFVFQGYDQTAFRNVFAPNSPGVEISDGGWGNFTCARGGIAIWTLGPNIPACV